MKFSTRLLFSLYIGFMAASAVYFLYGPSGYVTYKEISRDALHIEQNIVDLKKIHGTLAAEFELLRKSSEAVTLRARELGYLREGESVLEVPGLRKKPRSYAVGRIVTLESILPERGPLSLTAGILAMAAAFLVLASISPAAAKNR
jgi:cell division protein FtsB